MKTKLYFVWMCVQQKRFSPLNTFHCFNCRWDLFGCLYGSLCKDERSLVSILFLSPFVFCWALLSCPLNDSTRTTIIIIFIIRWRETFFFCSKPDSMSTKRRNNDIYVYVFRQEHSNYISSDSLFNPFSFIWLEVFSFLLFLLASSKQH